MADHELAARFPQHACSLTLCHNPQRDYHQTVALYLDDDYTGDLTFVSAEARALAITTDELWTLQWYPVTAIGFYAIAAPTLEALLGYAQEVERHGDTGGPAGQT